jgi:hypothetical protein
MANYSFSKDDEYVLQGDYGGSWEDLTAEETYGEIRDRYRDYEHNEGGRYRILKNGHPLR